MAVIPSCYCAVGTARRIAQQAPGSVALFHEVGCSQVGLDMEVTVRTLSNLGKHPNVGAVLVVGLGCERLKATELAQAQVATIRTKLLKIGAQVRVTVRKVWVSMASSYPWQDLYAQVWTNLRC